MKEINKIISVNLAFLRKKNNLTQLELAEKINYSDKAISKWENGEALPDIEVLYNLTQMYGVTLDFLTTENNLEKTKLPTSNKEAEKNNKIVITSLATSLVWIIATIVFVYSKLWSDKFLWQAFIWSIPASTIVLIVFNGIWGARKYTFLLVSILTWTLLASIYLSFVEKNIWLIFILGIPFQIAIILWSQLKKK